MDENNLQKQKNTVLQNLDTRLKRNGQTERYGNGQIFGTKTMKICIYKSLHYQENWVWESAREVGLLRVCKGTGVAGDKFFTFHFWYSSYRSDFTYKC